ncbi:WD40-repeat-containing domain protein [Gorgonomyces haynaldii]|nr:WD40-repeat-containing domain protein [Gorgonomyces haynaldii]
MNSLSLQSLDVRLQQQGTEIKYHAKTGARTTADYRADREINLAHFKELMRETADKETKTIGLQEFKKAFAAKEETQLFEENVLPRTSNPHKDMIVKIQYLSAAGRYMTVSREGTVAFWKENFKLQRSQVKDPKDMYKGGKIVSVRWVHDAYYIEQFQRLILATDDHQITVYDPSTMERCVVLDLQTSNPLTLDYYCSDVNASTSLLVYGTDQGCVNVFYFVNDKLSNTMSRKNSEVEHIYLEKEGPPAKVFKGWGTLWKRKAHNDWVLNVKYIPEMKAIMSTSPDSRKSLVVAVLDVTHKWQITDCSIFKGANCCAFSKRPMCIITGGSDHQVRLWNPRRLNGPPVALSGHTTPVSHVVVNETNGQCISLSQDKDVRVWDMRKQSCLQIFTHDSLEKPDDMFSALFFNMSGRGKILLASSHLKCYQLEERVMSEHPTSHDQPIRAVMYNPTFKVVVSGCDEGIVNIWDIDSGQRTFTFDQTHGASEITAMAFDSSQRRLFTGARDGTIKCWNFNNGQLMQDLVKDDKTEYVQMKKLSLIFAAGLNKRITVFVDDPNTLTLHPIYVWPEVTQHGRTQWHEDDMLAMDFYPPSTLATSSGDGEIVLVNLDSGHILHRLLIFLKTRTDGLMGALVTAGTDGMVRFWDVTCGYLVHEQQCTVGPTDGICAMQTNPSNTILVLGDSAGHVSLWDIQQAGYADELKTSKMTLLRRFKAHAHMVSFLNFSEDNELIMSGQFVGTFGQSELWKSSDPETYQYPNLPWDIEMPEVVQQQFARIKTATKQEEMVYGNGSDSWYRKTLFAKEHFKASRKKPVVHHASSHFRVYNRLSPFELTETKGEFKLPPLQK